MQPGPDHEGREVGDKAGCAWADTVCAITGGQSCIFCLVRPCTPRLPQGSVRGSHQNVPKVCASEKPCWVGWMRWKGRLESPKILPATMSTHRIPTNSPTSEPACFCQCRPGCKPQPLWPCGPGQRCCSCMGGTEPHALQVGCSPWALQQQCSAPIPACSSGKREQLGTGC